MRDTLVRPTADPTLHVAHVSKRFGTGATQVTAVRDVTLDVAPGEVVLIMGHPAPARPRSCSCWARS